MIGDNVTNDFLDNLGAEQYQKMHNDKKVTEFDKITPETYEKMNKEFVEDGTMVRIEVPTQEQIDKWKNWRDPDAHKRTVPPPDMVKDMWDAIGGRP
jgi:hypothetical protein|tara:strand:- start:42 stop:332 length:291 start_codon:yes stop_codon:yes gene_type:complete